VSFSSLSRSASCSSRQPQTGDTRHRQCHLERIHLVPFEVTIPRGERDKELPDKLRRELAGVLRWSVDGCLLWQREGLGASREVLGATEDYRIEMDVLGAFLSPSVCCFPDARVKSSDLYRTTHLGARAPNEKPLRLKEFVARLTGALDSKNKKSRRHGVGLESDCLTTVRGPEGSPESMDHYS